MISDMAEAGAVLSPLNTSTLSTGSNEKGSVTMPGPIHFIKNLLKFIHLNFPAWRNLLKIEIYQRNAF